MTHTHERMLARFIKQIDEDDDTPSLIMMIAADASHLQACRFIVEPAAEAILVPSATLDRICHDHGWQLRALREKLTPAAKALDILSPTDPKADFYRVLGIHKKAGLQEIKRAFRRQALKIHPDTATQLSANNQHFRDLNDAYRTLRNPVLRQYYDTARQKKTRWHESPTWFFPADRRSSIYLCYLGGLLVVFILLLLLMDIIVPN